VAGEVAAVGDGVTGFEVGDRVYAMLDGISGGYAGYAVVGEDATSTMPESLSYEEAAAVPLAALTAVQALRGALRDASTPHACDTGENERRRVLVNGASGGVGTFAVQLTRVFGAEVVGVSSARNAGLVRELGADCVVDYAEEDFTLHRERYDVVFDVVGNEGFTSCRKALKTGGIYVSTEPRPRNFLWQLLTFPGENRKGRAVIVRPSGRDLSLLKYLFEAGKLRVVLDRVYPLEDVAEAHSYGASGRARGKLVLRTTG
jgi:NADPH:quinone reductase-like Zn-dependent oxidoreductase